VHTGAYRYDYDDQLAEELDTGESLSEDFLLTATNSENKVVTQTLTVNLVGADDAPVLAVIESGLIAEKTESSEVTQSSLSGKLYAFDVDHDDELIFGIKNSTQASEFIQLIH
jgi:VCBS repeat-containing protein